MLDWIEIWGIRRSSQHLELFVAFLKPFLNCSCFVVRNISCWKSAMPSGNTVSIAPWFWSSHAYFRLCQHRTGVSIGNLTVLYVAPYAIHSDALCFLKFFCLVYSAIWATVGCLLDWTTQAWLSSHVYQQDLSEFDSVTGSLLFLSWTTFDRYWPLHIGNAEIPWPTCMAITNRPSSDTAPLQSAMTMR